MIYKNAKSGELKQKGQFKYRDAYYVHNGLLYHYTKLDNLWKILDSDSLYARNIRFSNDMNEYILGQTVIKHFINQCLDLTEREKERILEDIEENPIMHFMVCFCKNGDLLSQWRGYAQNGVSLGFDFKGGTSDQESAQKHIEYFCVLNNQKQQALYGENEKNKYFINDESLVFVQMPYQVQYISKDNDYLPKNIRDILQILWNGNPTYDLQSRIRMLFEYIPFIKNENFKEEEEHRLIFDMDYLGRTKAYNHYIQSRKTEYIYDKGIKKPYINVAFGTPERKCSNVSNLWIGDDVEYLSDLISDTCKQFHLSQIKRKYHCQGIYIGIGKNQEEIMLKIEEVLEENTLWAPKKSIRIWCEGHLPIREIIIGASEYQHDIKESLEYYKKTIYWLRYVDIRLSVIPLRK